MSTSNPYFIVICGFVLIFVLTRLIQNYRAIKLFKASFYTELYSGFFEYNLRRKSLKRLSTSNWLNSQFGEHRIFFQMAKGKNNEPQAYILLILNSGVYTILCKNYIGKIIGKKDKFELKSAIKDKKTGLLTKNKREVNNPTEEIADFNRRFKNYIGKDFNVHEIVVLTDKCIIDVEEASKKGIPFVNRNVLFDTIKKIHEASNRVISDDEIIVLYKCFMRTVNE